MSKAVTYIAAYDISDNRERDRVSRVLEGYGFRVQESVFECLLTRAMRRKMSAALGSLGLATGFVSIYRIYDRAAPLIIGSPPPPRVDEGCAYIV
jgi:CRISPR-associated protein Cas2